jgi:hypothetical protein
MRLASSDSPKKLAPALRMFLDILGILINKPLQPPKASINRVINNPNPNTNPRLNQAPNLPGKPLPEPAQQGPSAHSKHVLSQPPFLLSTIVFQHKVDAVGQPHLIAAHDRRLEEGLGAADEVG